MLCETSLIIDALIFAAKESSELNENPVHVVLPTSYGRFELDVTAMQRILLDPRVRDRHVVVLSIAGVQRLGKSFILNYLIRYLKSQVSLCDVCYSITQCKY